MSIHWSQKNSCFACNLAAPGCREQWLPVTGSGYTTFLYTRPVRTLQTINYTFLRSWVHRGLGVRLGSVLVMILWISCCSLLLLLLIQCNIHVYRIWIFSCYWWYVEHSGIHHSDTISGKTTITEL